MADTGAVGRALRIALIAYSALLALALLAPTSADQSALAGHVRDLGLRVGFAPDTATQGRAEFLCNVAILAPVTTLGSILFANTRWRDWVAVTFLLSGCVEVVQGLLLPLRTASSADVVANTLGGLVGAVAASAIRVLLRSRRTG